MLGINIALFFATLYSALYFYKNEALLTFILATYLATLIIINKFSPQVLTKIAIFTITLTISCILCVNFGLFQFNRTQFVIPLWLPLAWAITMIFAIKLQETKLS